MERMLRKEFLGLALICLVVTGCSDSVETHLFSESQAEKTLKAWVEKIEAQDGPAAADLSRMPFRFRTREWETREVFLTNLTDQRETILGLLRDAARKGEAFVYYSASAISGGRGPRPIPEERRDAELSRLGIFPEGWLAWLPESRVGIVLNPTPSRTDLAVQGFDPR